MMNIYEFTVRDQRGEEVSLTQYQGKVLLIVNTATKCGLTPQYTALQTLYEKYRDRGLEILDFPCNQFLQQAPGSDEEIHSFCTLNYNTTFPRFAKIDVNGEAAHPLYVWLKEQLPEDVGNENSAAFEQRVKGHTPEYAPGDIKWNFGKFLIDRSGNVAARFSPVVLPEALEAEIEGVL